VPLATGLYWFFFLNFNLAVFNALPIFPLDGGQAFKVGLKGATRGRLSDEALGRATIAVTFAILAMVLSLPLAAYLGII
jgi:membrane-associated protease RseP (regulator of RpoE activity)